MNTRDMSDNNSAIFPPDFSYNIANSNQSQAA